MNGVYILPTTVEHIRMLVADLREDDRLECEKWGLTPFKAVWREYRKSKWTHSYFVGNRIMAIGGLTGSVLGFVAKPWLMTSNGVNDYPFVFASIYRREAREMLKSYSLLETYADTAYTKSLKMLKIIGFKEREFVPAKNGLLVRLEMVA